MKKTEANRIAKYLAELQKVKEYLDESKAAKALKKVVSIMGNMAKKVDGAAVTNETKRKPSKYNLFLKSHYKEVAAANPGMTAPEIMKIIAKMYKERPSSKAASPKAASPKPASKKASKKASKSKSASPKPKATKPRKPRAPKA